MDSGEVLSVFLYSHTEANYVEKHLLTLCPLNISAFENLNDLSLTSQELEM